jgi:predicted Zn-dependent peptidase
MAVLEKEFLMMFSSRNVRALSGFALLCLVLAAFKAPAAYEQIYRPKKDDVLQASIYRLDNGLTVYLTEYHETPRFYAEIAVRAGSVEDPAETTGLAHYFEHLMFKGSRRLGTIDYEKEAAHLEKIADLYEAQLRAEDAAEREAIQAAIVRESAAAAQYAVPNELDQLYRSMGGRGINAHTWYDETVYKADLPANRLRQWAALESNRFQEPVFRLFQTELETVFEEVNRALDNKDRIIQYAVAKALYPDHPYGRPVLGWTEDIKKPSVRNIVRFFKTWYVPNNLCISISGDIDTEETIAVIDEYFSVLGEKPLPEREAWELEPLEGRMAVDTQYEGEEYALLAFRTVPHGHEDAEALMVLDMILDNSVAGLINLNLNQKQAVRNAGSYPLMLKNAGAQYLYGVPKKDQTLEEVEQLLLDQITRIREGKFEAGIIKAIINDFRKNILGGMESNEARSHMMARSFIQGDSWRYTLNGLNRLEKVRKKDVMRVAEQYFSGGYVRGFRHDAPHDVPKIPKPDLPEIDIEPSRHSRFAAEIMAMPAEPIEPEFVDPGSDYRKKKTPAGRTIYHVANPVNTIFDFSLSVDFGNHENNTIGTAVQFLEKSGTERLCPEALKKEWYRLGTDFNISASDNRTTISLRGLDRNFAASLALLKEALTEAEAPPGTLEELKKIMLARREDARKQADSLMSALTQYNRYGGESWYLRMLPEEELMALAAEDLHDLAADLLTYKQTVSYTGSLSAAEVEKTLEKTFGAEKKLKEPPPFRYLRVREPEQNSIRLVEKELAQAQIRIEFGSVPYDPALIPAANLFNMYFSGGMTGVVFQELREARALAYVAGAWYGFGYREKDQNIMMGVIQTQPDKTAEASGAFIELMDNMPVSDQRFAVAKDALLNQYRTGKLGFRQIAGAVQDWERHGLEPDPRRRSYAAVKDAGIDTLTAFHEAYIAGKNKIIGIVGDAARMNKDALAAMGTVETVTAGDIFID